MKANRSYFFFCYYQTEAVIFLCTEISVSYIRGSSPWAVHKVSYAYSLLALVEGDFTCVPLGFPSEGAMQWALPVPHVQLPQQVCPPFLLPATPTQSEEVCLQPASNEHIGKASLYLAAGNKVCIYFIFNFSGVVRITYVSTQKVSKVNPSPTGIKRNVPEVFNGSVRRPLPIALSSVGISCES